MAKKTIRKKIVLYTFSPELRADFQKLFVRSFSDMSEKEQEIFVSIGSQCAETGRVSYGQLRVVGCLFKKYLQDGEYVHHNWKIWRAKATKAS